MKQENKQQRKLIKPKVGSLKINEIDKPLALLMKKKGKVKINIKNEKEVITIGSKDIKRTMRISCP